MAKDKTPTSLPKCASCKRELGAEVNVLPFFVDDCARESAERVKHEAFCPRCFVYVRATREPERFPPDAFAAIKCFGKCGHEQTLIGHDAVEVALGHGECPQCGSRNIRPFGDAPIAS